MIDRRLRTFPAALPSLALVLTLGLGFLLSACASTAVAPGSDLPSEDGADGTLPRIMAGLSEDAAGVNAGIWLEDFDSIAASAQAIADHPTVSDEERASIQAVLGEDMADFALGDKTVHETAVSLVEAAKAQDMAEVLALNAKMQTECVACHTEFRGRLADR